MPSFAGYSSSVTFSSPTAGGGSQINVFIGSLPPPGVPPDPPGIGNPLLPLLYFSFVPAVSVSLQSTPAFTITLPTQPQPGWIYPLQLYNSSKASAGYQYFNQPTIQGSTLSYASLNAATTFPAGGTLVYALAPFVPIIPSPFISSPTPSPGATATASAPPTPRNSAAPSASPTA